MKHARPDYDRIQDPWGEIPADEPVFLLRAKDISAPKAVDAWAAEHLKHGGDSRMALMAVAQAKAMRDWQESHDVKLADTPPEGT